MRKECFALFLLCSCMTAPLMQDSGFAAIAVGTPISEIESIYGEPYDIRTLPNGMQEYRYVQRIPCGSSVEQTEYTFQVRQGKVVSKDRHQLPGSSIQITQ